MDIEVASSLGVIKNGATVNSLVHVLEAHMCIFLLVTIPRSELMLSFSRNCRTVSTVVSIFH